MVVLHFLSEYRNFLDVFTLYLNDNRKNSSIVMSSNE